MVDHGNHLLPMALSVLVPPVAVSLGRGGILCAVTTTEVAGGLGFLIEVGLDDLLVGGNVQELPRHAWGLTTERVDEHL